MAVQGVQLELVRLIALLGRDSSMPEVRDTLIAARLGLNVRLVSRLLEELALQGYLHLKRRSEPGYSTWLSPRGLALCPPPSS